MIKLAGDVLPVTDADRLLVTLSLQPSRLAVDLVGCIEAYPAIFNAKEQGHV